MQQEKKYPIGGYAPGNYHNRCSTCKRSFFGDKMAVQCELCAFKENEAITIPQHPGAVWIKGVKNFPIKKRVVVKMKVSHMSGEVVGFAGSYTGEMICFDWNVSSLTLPFNHEQWDNLFWLDESGQSKEGNKEREELIKQMVDIVREVADSGCDYESINFAKNLHDPECRACKATETLIEWNNQQNRNNENS